MADWNDVDRLATSLPEVEPRTDRNGLRQWRVNDKLIAWERPLRPSDLEALGDSAPEGPILGIRVPDRTAKEALLADEPDVYFTTPHFNGYPAVLAELDHITVGDLREALTEAWLSRAPKRLSRAWLADNPEMR